MHCTDTQQETVLPQLKSGPHHAGHCPDTQQETVPAPAVVPGAEQTRSIGRTCFTSLQHHPPNLIKFYPHKYHSLSSLLNNTPFHSLITCDVILGLVWNLPPFNFIEYPLVIILQDKNRSFPLTYSLPFIFNILLSGPCR